MLWKPREQKRNGIPIATNIFSAKILVSNAVPQWKEEPGLLGKPEDSRTGAGNKHGDLRTSCSVRKKRNNIFLKNHSVKKALMKEV